MIGATKHFATFSFRPLAFSNCSKMLNSAVTSPCTGLRKMTASSAYRDNLSLAYLPRRGLRIPSSVAIFRILCKASMARMNRYGDRGVRNIRGA
jgi:hypothetical protein